jgi:hypothetical protein
MQDQNQDTYSHVKTNRRGKSILNRRYRRKPTFKTNNFSFILTILIFLAILFFLISLFN